MATALSSMTPDPIVLTYDDLRGLPEDGQRYELFEGELQVTPAPTTTHQRISRNLEFLLHVHVEQHDLGEVLDAPVDVLLGRTTVVQPDLVFVARARTGIITERGVEGAPDLVVEILSPSTEQRDRGAKQQLYARHGIPHYWLLDGATQTLSELALHERAYGEQAIHQATAPIKTRLFPNLAIDLATVFRKPKP